MSSNQSLRAKVSIVALSLASVSLSIAPLAHAEDVSATASGSASVSAQAPRAPFQTLRDKLMQERSNVREDIRNKREEARGDIRDMRREMASSTKEMRGEMRDNRREMASSSRETRMENRDNRLNTEATKRFTLILKRLSAAVDRLNNIAGRLDTRIAKLKSAGINTSSAESLQVAAKAKIVTADLAVKALVMPTLPPVGASTTPQQINDAMKTARAQASTAENAIKEAQKALNAVVVEIKAKGGVRADDENATSTRER